MQHLNTLWQIANTASQVAEVVRSAQTFRFNIEDPTQTFYLHTANAEVRIVRWNETRVEVTAQLQAPFAWRVETDQDEAGVYFVARRRPVVGSLAGAVFSVQVPHDMHVALRLEDCRLTLDEINGTVELPPNGRGILDLKT
jgi:hypothetical protein